MNVGMKHLVISSMCLLILFIKNIFSVSKSYSFHNLGKYKFIAWRYVICKYLIISFKKSVKLMTNEITLVLFVLMSGLPWKLVDKVQLMLYNLISLPISI